MRYDGRVVVVTGAGRGIGRAYALAFADEGAAVVVISRTADEVDGTVSSIRDVGGTAFAGVADVTDDDAIGAIITAAARELGGIDVLVNNAGLQFGKWNECLALPHDDWRHLLDVNVLGALVCIQQCQPHLAQRAGAAVLNQSSVGAGQSRFGAYGVSKLALDGLTKAMAAELAGDGIRVNGIAPGVIVTPEREPTIDHDFLESWVATQAVDRPGQTADPVGTALFLCSDDASFITGQVLAVDGGWNLNP